MQPFPRLIHVRFLLASSTSQHYLALNTNIKKDPLPAAESLFFFFLEVCVYYIARD